MNPWVSSAIARLGYYETPTENVVSMGITLSQSYNDKTEGTESREEAYVLSTRIDKTWSTFCMYCNLDIQRNFE